MQIWVATVRLYSYYWLSVIACLQFLHFQLLKPESECSWIWQVPSAVHSHTSFLMATTLFIIFVNICFSRYLILTCSSSKCESPVSEMWSLPNYWLNCITVNAIFPWKSKSIALLTVACYIVHFALLIHYSAFQIQWTNKI